MDSHAAANDEGLAEAGECKPGRLVMDLLRNRVKTPRPVTEHFRREALLTRMRSALRPGCILHLEAPAGYGKSCELAAALSAAEHAADAVSWVTLNHQDNEPSRLLSLLSIALHCDTESGPPAITSDSSQLADALDLLLVQYARGAAGAEPRVLVLDGLDVLSSSAAIALIRRLLAHLPPSLSLALTSRQSLPFETHAYEIQGRFTRLSSDQLELSREETLAFFQPLMDRDLVTQVAVEHVYSLTEGWLTPLALYRLEVQAHGESRLPIQEARNVVAFLNGAVSGQLTQAQRRSLMVMSEMDAVSDELFQAIADPHCALDYSPSRAAAAGMPVRGVPNRGRWFRVLPLVREWLLAEPSPGRAARATLACDWFSRQGQFTEALRYALMCDDSDRALAVASSGSEDLLISQDTASLLTLRRSLPLGLIQSSPRLRVVYSWVHAIGGQFREARGLLEGLCSKEQEELSGRISALRAFLLSGEGNIEAALPEADAALDSAELSCHGRLVTLLVKSGALCALGRFAEARSANRSAARLAREAGDAGSEMLTVYAHARIELAKGALKHAERLLRTGLDTAVSEPVRPPRVGEGRLMINLALVMWHQGRIAEADRLLTRIIRQADQTRDLALLLALAVRVLISKAQDRLDEAFAWIGVAERTMHAWQVDDAVFVPVLEALKISCWLATGQWDSAAQSMTRLSPYREQFRVLELFPMMPGLLDTLEVRVALAADRLDEARDLLDRPSGGSDQGRHFGHQLHLSLLGALTSFRQGEKSRAFEAVRKVVELAEPEHYISPFIELKGEIRELVAQGLAGSGRSRVRDSLRELFGLTVEPAAGIQASTLPDPISDREFGVLELIAMGLSNQEIADRLHISLHTVKTHARRINAKLGVKSRTQAIVRARELGLL
ncbi:LuxR C-terminal-related transcriptional regulator [Marinobacter sp. SS21]|uniref:LuxR C-terminal-related transcriptional regulator n=1 Tax=Marinobacter sp. SS21 TaxID=2979460 RepID=UPI00232B6858|nr:LuxR C-terminal-related transcriptional regulator [Marinobacter sp. SS21]MDC0661769.1 LuxR C-terminal-related transcriptional regulator [Marinobacter sp. SS21]